MSRLANLLMRPRSDAPAAATAQHPRRGRFTAAAPSVLVMLPLLGMSLKSDERLHLFQQISFTDVNLFAIGRYVEERLLNFLDIGNFRPIGRFTEVLVHGVVFEAAEATGLGPHTVLGVVRVLVVALAIARDRDLQPRPLRWHEYAAMALFGAVLVLFYDVAYLAPIIAAAFFVARAALARRDPTAALTSLIATSTIHVDDSETGDSLRCLLSGGYRQVTPGNVRITGWRMRNELDRFMGYRHDPPYCYPSTIGTN